MELLKKLGVGLLVAAAVGLFVFKINEMRHPRLRVTMFTAVWCPSCVFFRPIFETVRKDMEDRADFVVIDVDQEVLKSNAAHIRQVPTVIVQRGTKTLWRSDASEDYMSMTSSEGFKLLLELLEVQ